MEEKPSNKPLSLLEIVREAVKETEEEERERDRYFREMIKERLLQNEYSTISETDTVFKFRKTSIPLIEIEKHNLKIEYLDWKHNDLEEEKLNINEEIAEIKMLEKNMREQFNDLGGEDWIGPPRYALINSELLYGGLPGDHISESGWSSYNRERIKDYRRELIKPLPIGSGICYVLSVPENENWSKIGFTTKSAQVRADDYSKQHDLELNVAGIIADENAAALEKILHEEFSSKRVEHGSAKEIFAVSPREAIKKIKSYKRKVSEEMQNRQLLLIGRELLKIDAKIAKEMYRISSKDETIAIIILEQKKLFRDKLKNIYDLKISPNSRKRWYRLFGWKGRLSFWK